jgi:hypothetical protein
MILKHDLFGKSVPTFSDHAVCAGTYVAGSILNRLENA